eukprot:7229552-Alexandrium_andersonii.AAC.1
MRMTVARAALPFGSPGSARKERDACEIGRPPRWELQGAWRQPSSRGGTLPSGGAQRPTPNARNT